MIITKYGLTYEQPSFAKTGNVFFRANGSRENIERLIRECGVNAFIEPNVGQTGTMLEVDTVDVALALNPWNANYTKCDALHISVDFLKKNNFALFARSADCMMLSLLSQQDVYLLHLSVESINNGILRLLDMLDASKNYLAIEGPCISAEEYYLYGDQYIANKTGNYAKLGYMDRTCLGDKGLHIDIRGIARDVLKKCGISMVVEDKRCTFSDASLGSNRRQGANRHDNVVIIR
ncbi:MAG: laccase domain-containing protein [Clostridia bacterium]|nr:laccase domain-containing protein [Clostridia bacterium]